MLGEHRVACLDDTGRAPRPSPTCTATATSYRGAAPSSLELYSHFAPGQERGVRTIIDVTVQRVSDSCGFSVPLMSCTADRDLLVRSHARLSDDDLTDYGAERNSHSIDGLPALEVTVQVRAPAP